MEDVKVIIKRILDRMSLEYDRVEKYDSALPEHEKFVIHTDDPGIFIGKNGEHLHALSLVVRKIVQSKSNEEDQEKQFFIDVGEYEADKIKKIQRIAYTMAGRAKTFEKDVALDPMTSYERMIVHQTLADDPEVTTESEGSGRARHVVVSYIKTEE